jgi:hypothetical protein
MPEDRIKSEFTVGYKAINAAGLVALEINTTIKVADQSPESASAHLAAAVAGLMAPATKQAGV